MWVRDWFGASNTGLVPPFEIERQRECMLALFHNQVICEQSEREHNRADFIQLFRRDFSRGFETRHERR
jgi:hypothetical protein